MSKYKYAYLVAIAPAVLGFGFESVVQLIQPSNTGAEGVLSMMGGLASIVLVLLVGVFHIAHMVSYFVSKSKSTTNKPMTPQKGS